MSIDFTVDETNPAYVRLPCQGTYTRDALLSVVDEAIDIAASQNRRAVLVDIRDVKGTPPDMFGRYQLGVGTAKIQREKSVLVTIAVVGNEPMIDPQRLGETVFLNRGGIGKVFTNVDEAVAWLEQRLE
ncbi:MAG: hypothetical protein OEP48_06730 [Betaproteobacteria bacterium]|nr:hypothetical protein [Betaproteobacteria bacterium]MDH3436158.1 hypothetical protein [Betaproteobacteria bacterium]